MNERPEISILSSEQCFGDNALNIFNSSDLKKAKATIVSYPFKEVLYDMCSSYWLLPSQNILEKFRTAVEMIDSDGCGLVTPIINEQNGVRLTLDLSNFDIINCRYISNICKNDDIISFNYGEYAQTISRKICLDESRMEIKGSCHLYLKHKNKQDSFTLCEKRIYVNTDDGKKYVRLNINQITLNEETKKELENYDENLVWVEIKPIKWLKHVNDDIAVSENILFYMQFSKKRNVEYEDSDIKFYIDNYLSKEIIQLAQRELCQKSTGVHKSNGNKINEKSEKFNDNIKGPFYKSVHLKNTDDFYGNYLTDNVYKDNPAIGRTKEVRELEKNLLIPKKSVILVGNEGVGKTAIVEGLAYNIQKQLVCDMLKNKGILSVNVNSLLAGCRYRGDFEEKIKKLCESLIESKNIILFLDEMHTTIGAGSASEQSLDMANIMKIYISQDQIKIIGCTTKDEYEKYFAEDKAYRRRFNVVEVNEPTLNVTKKILWVHFYQLMEYSCIQNNLTVKEIESLLDLIISLSQRKQKFSYVKANNPDASIDILDSCFAYLMVENIKNATYKHFINGIIDNSKLSLSKMEIENCLPTIEDIKEDIDETKVKRMKIQFSSNKIGI